MTDVLTQLLDCFGIEIQEAEGPTEGSELLPESLDHMQIDLDDAMELPLATPEQGYARVLLVLLQYGFVAPVHLTLDPLEGEEVIALTTTSIETNFVYLNYGLLEDGTIEMGAEVVNESGLIEILSDDDEDPEILMPDEE